MIFTTLCESADKGELLLVDGGLCRFHVRKNGQLTIREIIVLPEKRRQGIGRRMVEGLIASCSKDVKCVVASCPRGLASNYFWKRMGFDLIGQKEIKKGKWVLLWQRSLSSSTVPMATQLTLASPSCQDGSTVPDSLLPSTSGPTLPTRTGNDQTAAAT